MVPKRPQDHPEAFPGSRVHPGAPQETPREAEIASRRASGSVFGRLWTRLERHLGLLGIVFRGDFEIKIKIDSGNADFRKSMLSPRREHRFGGREGPEMEPRTLRKGPCEAQQAPEERHSASDDAHSALSEAQVAPTPIFSRFRSPPGLPDP